MKRVILGGLLLGLLMGSGVSFAHHGKGVQYQEQRITLTGTVTKCSWTNPHVFIYFDVKDDKGKVTNWGVELTNPRSLTTLGMSADMFKVGNVIKMEFQPSRSGVPRGEGSGGRIWNADGQMIWNGAQGYRGVDTLYRK